MFTSFGYFLFCTSCRWFLYESDLFFLIVKFKYLRNRLRIHRKYGNIVGGFFNILDDYFYYSYILFFAVNIVFLF